MVYSADKVKVLAEGIATEGLTLTFEPPRESGYSCPGVKFIAAGTTIRFTYVRSPIGTESPVDIVAKPDGDTLKVTFPFPEGKWEKGSQVELIDGTGKSLGRWTNAGEPNG